MQTTPVFPYSSPEARGISSTAILDFVEAVERNLDSVHSFMLLRHGRIIAEGWWDPYRPEYPHMLYSLSKSFTSTAIGLLVAEGRLTVDDLVVSFFPDDVPAQPSADLLAMRVRHLLTMSTGHSREAMEAAAESHDANWVRAFLNLPVEYFPGTRFFYESGATYMLSAIVQKLSGMRMLDYLQARLFAPLGITRPRWETSPQGINTGGWGLNVTTADIAALGQLYLQHGVWQGAHILPEAWVREASSYQIFNGPAAGKDWEQGYGFQFWRCQHNGYRGDGAFGQYCIVLPEQDAVLAITSGLGDMQQPLNLVWQHLLPAMNSVALPENPAAQAALANKLAKLQLPLPEGQAITAFGESVSGRRYRMEENWDGIQEFRFDFNGEQSLITLRNHRGEQRITCGHSTWVNNLASIDPLDNSLQPAFAATLQPAKIAAACAWTGETSLVVKLWWNETPYARTLTCRFENDRLTVGQKLNVSFGPTEGPVIQGRFSE